MTSERTTQSSASPRSPRRRARSAGAMASPCGEAPSGEDSSGVATSRLGLLHSIEMLDGDAGEAPLGKPRKLVPQQEAECDQFRIRGASEVAVTDDQPCCSVAAQAACD